MTGQSPQAPAGRLHLVVDISAHGFGHVAMTGPVVNRLARSLPALCLTVRSALPEAKLAEHIHFPFTHVPRSFDIGMAMTDALAVDADRSFDFYASQHRDWDATVAAAADELEALRPDFLLGNIPYLSLAAARRIGCPAFAMCCLHWADIFRHYCRDRVGADAIERQIRQAYAGADLFLRPSPGMPMPEARNVHAVGPIGRVGVPGAEAIRGKLGLPAGTRLALLSLGGIGYRLDVSGWPELPGWCVLTGMKVEGEHPAVASVERLGMDYIDVFASTDAVIAKLGYGTVAEAGVNGRPLLYVPRDDWPEEPCLAEWLGQHGRCRPIPAGRLVHGDLADDLDAVCALEAPVAPVPTGAGEAADAICRRLQALQLLPADPVR